MSLYIYPHTVLALWLPIFISPVLPNVVAFHRRDLVPLRLGVFDYNNEIGCSNKIDWFISKDYDRTILVLSLIISKK
jgi:hypothetical protein